MNIKRIMTTSLAGLALAACLTLAPGAAAYAAESALDTGELFSDRDMEQTADLADAVKYNVSDGEDIHITAEGIYVLSGSAENVTVYVEAGDGDKVQLVLCGYDLRGTITMVDKDGKPTGQRPIEPKESVWYRYEQNLTKDYSLVSPEYRDFLMQFIPNSQYPGVRDEFYRREWTKDVNNFATHYRNIDVLLAPLDTNSFNEVKSELKFAEAGFTRTAVVCSEFGPYTIGSKSIFKKGGEIDETGNCVLIDPAKKHKAWVKAILRLAYNPELIKLLQDNMYEHVKDIYDINKVTADRAKWYKEIVKK